MSDPVLLIEQHDDIDWLILNRPGRMNAFNWELRDRLFEGILAAKESSSRALVITGTGRAFCAGADVVDVLDGEAGTAIDDRQSQLATTHDMIRQLRNMPKPVFAAVNGVAAGGGWALAMAADCIVASAQARFVPAFAAIALVPDMGAMHFLPHRTGLATAIDIFTTRTQLDAHEALRVGAVDYVVAPRRLRRAIIELVNGVDGRTW